MQSWGKVGSTETFTALCTHKIIVPASCFLIILYYQLSQLMGEIHISLITDIDIMDAITTIQLEKEESLGQPLLNVSHWNSCNKYKQAINSRLDFRPIASPWDYTYTYDIDLTAKRHALLSLGIPHAQINTAMGLVVQSSTIAIINVANMLKQLNYKKVCIVQPSYFSVPRCFDILHLSYNYENTIIGTTVELPIKRILENGYDVVWITSPLFSGSQYYTDKYFNQIRVLADSGIIVVADESLALPGHEILREVGISDKFIGIYSPHKAISINGMKFSIIITSIKYEVFLEQWVDVLSGSLPQSTYNAFTHYTSKNYKECVLEYNRYVKRNQESVSNIVANNRIATTCPNTYGHYIVIFLKSIAPELFNSLPFQRMLVYQTCAALYPGNLHGYDDSYGACFRVNLTLDAHDLASSLHRILHYLEMIKH